MSGGNRHIARPAARRLSLRPTASAPRRAAGRCHVFRYDWGLRADVRDGPAARLVRFAPLALKRALLPDLIAADLSWREAIALVRPRLRAIADDHLCAPLPGVQPQFDAAQCPALHTGDLFALRLPAARERAALRWIAGDFIPHVLPGLLIVTQHLVMRDLVAREGTRPAQTAPAIAETT